MHLLEWSSSNHRKRVSENIWSNNVAFLHILYGIVSVHILHGDSARLTEACSNVFIIETKWGSYELFRNILLNHSIHRRGPSISWILWATKWHICNIYVVSRRGVNELGWPLPNQTGWGHLPLISVGSNHTKPWISYWLITFQKEDHNPLLFRC